MSLEFPGERATAYIEKILVTRDAFRSTEPWVLPLEFGYFVDHALDNAMYEEDDLPREAVLMAKLQTYIGEWSNGGHSGYAGNLMNPEECSRETARALGLLDLHTQQRVVQDFNQFAKDYPKRFKRFHGEYADIDPYFYDLDDRLSALGGVDPITRRLGEWLRTRDWLHVVDDGRPFTAQTLTEWIPNHTDYDRRKAKRVLVMPEHLRAPFENFRAWLGRTKN